jgi:hypothetical protein
MLSWIFPKGVEIMGMGYEEDFLADA